MAVEAGYPLIVGRLVTQEVNDKQQLKPVLAAVREQSGQKPAEVVSDSGYCSNANLKHQMGAAIYATRKTVSVKSSASSQQE